MGRALSGNFQTAIWGRMAAAVDRHVARSPGRRAPRFRRGIKKPVALSLGHRSECGVIGEEEEPHESIVPAGPRMHL